MKKLSALLFDVDGTLADTERAHLEAFNWAFTQAGLEWCWSSKLYTDLLEVTGGRERIRHYIETFLPDFKAPIVLSEYIATLHREKTARYVSMLNQGAIHLRPGVERLLREAHHEGIRLAIVTTTSPENVSALLDNTLGKEAITWFEVIGAGNVVPKKKPAPDIYNYVLTKMNLTPSACIAFEDSGMGVQSACAAHIPVIATMNEFTRHHNFEGMSLLLDSFGEPDQACSVIKGNLLDRTYLDLDLIRRIHAHAILSA